MNSLTAWMKLGVFCLVFLFAGTKSPSAFSSRQSQTVSPCSAPEFREFDFWAGDWDAFEIGSGTKDSRVRVDRILEGCVLREDYAARNGHKGQSFTIYDASRKLWHQTWVTNRGQLLVIEGQFESGAIVLSGSDLTPSGGQRQVRGTWKPVEGGVQETAVISTDAGKTWQPWFDLMFRPHSSGAAATANSALSDDAKAVAALDTQFQAAVKANDVATVDRLLPADYILVTSSGKVFTKADLLEEARSATRHYEHQEDTDQTVRVWGDTAVITAKLWAKGTENGQPFEYKLWFSDTYVRTPAGWRYSFAQSSSRLPPTPPS
jgi:ketosteroid isomerase-like protein